MGPRKSADERHSVGRGGIPSRCVTVVVAALFDCQIRMQMAASFAEMDEIRSIFAQIPHSKESLLQSEGEKREREKQTGRREGNMYADLRLTGASEAGANLCCLPSPFGTIKAMTTMMMSASNSESSHLFSAGIYCRAARRGRNGFLALSGDML